jgi:cell division septation protein DedD
VIATANQSSAETLLKTLKDKGFPVSMSPGPNNLMRILVGPYTDTQSMGRAKTELESAGFHPIRK